MISSFYAGIVGLIFVAIAYLLCLVYRRKTNTSRYLSILNKFVALVAFIYFILYICYLTMGV